MTLQTNETEPSLLSDATLLEQLQSRSDDRAAWDAAVEIFRRAGSGTQIPLPLGYHSKRPEVQAVLEAAVERTRGGSPHWALSRLLSDSRHHVRFTVLELMADIAFDNSMPQSEQQKAMDHLERALSHECPQMRTRASFALSRRETDLGAAVTVMHFKNSLQRGRWLWAFLLISQGSSQTLWAIFEWVVGNSTGVGRLAAGLLMLFPGIIIVRSIPYYRRRSEFLRTLDSLERIVETSPQSARAALEELQVLSQLRTPPEIRERARRMVASIRATTVDGLPVAVSEPPACSDTLPLPAENPVDL